MNIRKPTDYSAVFSALDQLMASRLSQMELYCEIGRLVAGRAEKGAAVAASEYLQTTYPMIDGFSPRNLRRMRAFYASYAESPGNHAAGDKARLDAKCDDFRGLHLQRGTNVVSRGHSTIWLDKSRSNGKDKIG